MPGMPTVSLALDLIVTRVDLVDEGANSEAFIELCKRKEPVQPMDLEEILAKMSPEHATVIRDSIEKAKTTAAAAATEEVQKSVTELQKQLNEKTEALTKEQEKYSAAFDELETMKRKTAEPDAPSFEDVLKSVDPKAAAMLRSMQAAKEVAESELRKARESAEQEEALAKAKALDSLPVDEAVLVPLMKGISTDLYDVLVATNKAIVESGAFTELGKSKTTDTDAATAQEAFQQLEKKATEIAARDKITVQAAFGKAVKENRDLYNKYLAGGAN